MKTQLNNERKDSRWKASFLSDSPTFVLSVQLYKRRLNRLHELLGVETIGISPHNFDDPECEFETIIDEYLREYEADFYILSRVSVSATCEVLEGEGIADILKIIDRVLEGFRASTSSIDVS